MKMGVISYYNRYIYGIIGTITKLYCVRDRYSDLLFQNLIFHFGQSSDQWKATNAQKENIKSVATIESPGDHDLRKLSSCRVGPVETNEKSILNQEKPILANKTNQPSTRGGGEAEKPADESTPNGDEQFRSQNLLQTLPLKCLLL